MKHEELKKILCENLTQLKKSLLWLNTSYKKAIKINFDEELTEEDYEILETLSARFGRTVDILINKVLRTLDLYELEDTTRKLDTVIRAEKRGFVEDYKILISMKDLRNEIVHEYIEQNLKEKFKEVLDYTPILFSTVEKVQKYLKDTCESENTKAFTLVEVLIAVVILGISFTVLLNLLYQGQKDLAIAQDTFYNFLMIDGAVKEGKTNNINITTKELNVMSLPLIEKTYEKNGIYLKTYQPK